MVMSKAIWMEILMVNPMAIRMAMQKEIQMAIPMGILMIVL